MSFFVRPARPDDAATIVEFNRRLAHESENVVLDPQILAPGVAAILADGNRGRYFVAEQAGSIIGQLMITYEWSDWRNGWIWWLQSVYVHADFRRNGVFRALFQHVEREAKSTGVVLMRLYVEDENNSAQATYQRLGFDEMHFQLYQKSL
jgi:GNAT superfamily N-acetyltransferase